MTSHGETALKNGEFVAFDLLIGTLRRACYKDSHIHEKIIINWKNCNGETALHIATDKNRPQVSTLFDVDLSIFIKVFGIIVFEL